MTHRQLLDLAFWLAALGAVVLVGSLVASNVSRRVQAAVR